MKVSSDVVKDLLAAIREVAEPESLDTGIQILTLYRLDDVIAMFTTGETPVFHGVTFEALGQDFSIINNLELLVRGENDEGDEEAFIVGDREVPALEEFLIWRTRTIRSLGF